MARVTRHAEYRITTRNTGAFRMNKAEAMRILGQVPENFTGTVIIARSRTLVVDPDTQSNGHLLCGICRSGVISTVYLRRIGQTNQMPSVWENGSVRSAKWMS